MRIVLPFLGEDPDAPFPPVERALREPDGLLAAGGDLSLTRLLRAYTHGVFPWYMAGEPILWWSPDPRAVFHTDAMHCARRLRRWLAHCPWTVRADADFPSVMRACAAPRDDHGGTWITPEMAEAYTTLHAAGYAHSIEVMDADELVGGLYGVAIGRMFFAESMFSHRTNGSKVALLALAQVLHSWGFPLIDAQVASPHLFTLGAQRMSRQTFSLQLAQLCPAKGVEGHWRRHFGPIPASDLA
jgi:leucyl/phenylalanyl-tRNA---protein transferase